MKAYLDIENAKTKLVNTLELEVKEFNHDNILMDISKLKQDEMHLLLDAINPDLKYTDIELFFIDDDKKPYFGPDYIFTINNNLLQAYYIRNN